MPSLDEFLHIHDMCREQILKLFKGVTEREKVGAPKQNLAW